MTRGDPLYKEIFENDLRVKEKKVEKNYMSKQEKYLMKAKDNYEKAIGVMREKSSDYAQTDDPYSNFRGSEFLGVDLKRGILIRTMDKLSRINNLIDREAVVEESVQNDCLDLMNYFNIVLMKFQEEKKDREKNTDKLEKFFEGAKIVKEKNYDN